MPRSSRIESVLLNIQYDDAFETLYLAYVVGLTQLGLRIRVDSLRSSPICRLGDSPLDFSSPHWQRRKPLVKPATE